jgi:hypothetical protein
VDSAARVVKAEGMGHRAEGSGQIESDAETGGHGDAARKDQRSEVGGRRSEVRDYPVGAAFSRDSNNFYDF